MSDTYTREQIVRKLRKLIKDQRTMLKEDTSHCKKNLCQVCHGLSEWHMGNIEGIERSIATFKKGKAGK